MLTKFSFLIPGTKASYKQSVDVTVHRRKADRVEEDPSSPPEKVVTVDVEMGGNETPVDDEPKEIKVDAVMAVETEPVKVNEVQAPKSTLESKAAEEKKDEKKKSETTPVEVKPECKDNDKVEVKDVKNQTPSKVVADVSADKSEEVKTEKAIVEDKADPKVVEAKE